MDNPVRDLNTATGGLLDIHLFALGGTEITLATLVVFLLIVALTFFTSRLLQKVLGVALKKRGFEVTGSMAILQRLLHYLVLLVGVSIALQTVGIKLGALFAAGAVFAVGIGLAMQDVAKNFVSGFILLLERSIKPGDVLNLDGAMVLVKRMGIRATIVRTHDGIDLIVPNGALVQSTVHNLTLRRNQHRLRVQVGVHYDSDMALVRRTLEGVARSLPFRVKDDERFPPAIIMGDFADSAVPWELCVWVDDPWLEPELLGATREAVWGAFQQTGVVIAYPQLDVHLDPPQLQSVGAGSQQVG